MKSIFDNLKLKKQAETFEFPPVYKEDLELMLKAHQFQCDRLKGEIEFAEFFSLVVAPLAHDKGFLRKFPEFRELRLATIDEKSKEKGKIK